MNGIDGGSYCKWQWLCAIEVELIFAAKDGSYRGLAKHSEVIGDTLHGEIILPLTTGSVVINRTAPLVKVNL